MLFGYNKPNRYDEKYKTGNGSHECSARAKNGLLQASLLRYLFLLWEHVGPPVTPSHFVVIRVVIHKGLPLLKS